MLFSKDIKFGIIILTSLVFLFVGVGCDKKNKLVEFGKNTVGRQTFAGKKLIMDIKGKIGRKEVASVSDPDHDGIASKKELELGIDPHNSDTDGDGINDGEELFNKTNPLVPEINIKIND